MKTNYDFLCVDFQKDFASAAGKNFNKGDSSRFIQDTLFPFLVANSVRVSEIVSDYRLPRGKSKNESCVPGMNGYESMLPPQLRKGKPWVKCMHNPLWTRKNIGVANAPLGEIYQDSQGFNKWIAEHIECKKVVLFGLTADCCVLQVASELYFRGYDVYVIYEATDPMNERLEHKDSIMYRSSLNIYATTIHFDELVAMLEDNGC